ncbi:hypothetical protein SAY87_020083 [Trapa incisa]|uniref:DUF7912 domain-containing protein n=1 Tax=Trapa incisa TaxID=236973 RepID=A0AAN7K6U6_9MYRT|nr:hypothetical protein SAY87_020083 [Trapa incisa]
MTMVSRTLRFLHRPCNSCRRCLRSSSFHSDSPSAPLFLRTISPRLAFSSDLFYSVGVLSNSYSLSSPFTTTGRSLNTKSGFSDGAYDFEDEPFSDEVDGEEHTADEWEEEEEEAQPKLGDGGDGGGIVLNDVPWGEQALEIAREVLSHCGDDVEIFAFKTTPRGYIYVRIDKLSNKYGCPSFEEIKSYSQEYKKVLDEAGDLGKLPKNLALEVSSPGAERLLKVPDDLLRFQDMPMRVSYMDDGTPANYPEKTGVFFLESIEPDSGLCVWKLADVKENRDPQSMGRGLSRKQKDWRLEIPCGILDISTRIRCSA